MRINMKDMDEATREFAEDVFEAIDSAALPRAAANRIAQARGIAQAIAERNIPWLSSIPADQVHLTDQQWDTLATMARVSTSMHRAEEM